MTWPHGDHSATAKAAVLRLAAFFAYGPAARAFAATLGLDAPTRSAEVYRLWRDGGIRGRSGRFPSVDVTA